MIDSMIDEISRLQLRINELEAAILKHASAKGDDICWENDVELWSVIGLTEYPHDTLLPKEVMLENCCKYINSRYEENSFQKDNNSDETNANETTAGNS